MNEYQITYTGSCGATSTSFMLTTAAFATSATARITIGSVEYLEMPSGFEPVIGREVPCDVVATWSRVPRDRMQGQSVGWKLMHSRPGFMRCVPIIPPIVVGETAANQNGPHNRNLALKRARNKRRRERSKGK